MKRWVSTLGIVALCWSTLAADVTVTSTMNIEGGAPGMAGQGGMTPRMVTRIKGVKARSDVEVNGQVQTSITDLAAKQIIVLQHAQKTAQVYSHETLATASKPGASAKIDVSSKPTGRARTIDGTACDEYTLKMAMSMTDFAGAGSMPPQAAEMMKDVRMVISGSVWVAKNAPGAADFMAFQKAAAGVNMAAAVGAVIPGVQAGGIDRLLKTLAAMPGVPYLTELQMTVEGTGQMVEAMKQMGGMKVKNAVTAISIDPIPDTEFQVPAGYTIVKQ